MSLFGNPGGDQALAVGLSRVLFPIVTLLGVSGIIVGILNSYDEFTVPAISPVFWNLAIIVGLVIGVPQATTMNTKLYVYAVLDPDRDGDPDAAAGAVAARPRRPPADGDRLARPRGQTRLRPDGAGDARSRA